jgi:hypothetical protein
MSESPKKRALESEEESDEEWVGPRFDENTPQQNEREEEEKKVIEVQNKKLQIKKQKSPISSKNLMISLSLLKLMYLFQMKN